MRITAALIAALLLSLVVLSGCATKAPVQNEAAQTQTASTATPEQVASEASSQIVQNNSDVQIGEMI